MGDVKDVGWELTKENIQPLSNGRRMTYLAEALPVQSGGGFGEMQQYEEIHMGKARELEESAKSQVNPKDPLQGWIDVVTYIEQHFPTLSHHVKEKYSSLLKDIVRRFFQDERYPNDKRFVDILLKNCQDFPAQRQLSILLNLYEQGYGAIVSEMYVRIAELYQREGDTKNACAILKEGIQNCAQPLNQLNELLAHIQEIWAQNYAKRIQNGESNNDAERSRNFAAAVPTYGENNEAVSIRQFLQPSAPAESKPKQPGDRHMISVFADQEEETGPRNEPIGRQLPCFDLKQGDSENRVDASRWNTGDTQLNNPVISQPPEKMKLYVDTDDCPRQSSKVSQVVSNHILKDRKEEEEKLNERSGTGTEDGTQCIVSSKKKSQEVELTKKQFTRPRRNYEPNLGNQKNFFEDIKYKICVPPGRVVNRVGLKEDEWWDLREEKEKRLREQKMTNSEVIQLRKQIEALMKDQQSLEKLKLAAEEKLTQKDERIKMLEDENESLLSQLTCISTEKNVLESRIYREAANFERRLQEAREANENIVSELQEAKTQTESLRQEILSLKSAAENQRFNENESSEFEIHIGATHRQAERHQVIIDVENRSRQNDNYSGCTSSEQEQGGSSASDPSRFNSGENTVTTTSFMPNLDEMSISYGGGNAVNYKEPARKALAVVGLAEMMNTTPAGPRPDDIDEIPPPNFGFPKKPIRMFNLYESCVADASYRKPSVFKSSSLFGANKKDLSSIRDQENALPSNLPIPTENADENIQPVDIPELNFSPKKTITVTEDKGIEVSTIIPEFVKPDLPSFKKPDFPFNDNAKTVSVSSNDRSPTSTSISQRISSLRPIVNGNSSEDDDEDLILRRHQQTGMDLNISNLTCALMLGPKPLVNSTPEHERTNRNLLGLLPPTGVAVQNINAQLEMEETDIMDSHGVTGSRMSRYQSLLTEPPMNLSTIQETSRENRSRSRSTTGSSSGNTMSSTRFGLTGTTTSTTPYYGNLTRSSSVPRSINRIPQQQFCSSNTGYYSDTNMK